MNISDLEGWLYATICEIGIDTHVGLGPISMQSDLF